MSDAVRAMNDGARPARAWLREAGAYALVFAVLAYAWTFSDVTVPNERTRAYLAAAIVDDGSVAIDGPIAHFGRVYDLAERDGHFYSDKAPGSSLLGAAVYAVGRRVAPGVSTDPVRLVNLFRTWLMLPLGMLAFDRMRALLRGLGRSESAVALGSFGLALCTPFFHYATAFYGHVVVVAFWLVALRALQRAGVLAGDATAPSALRSVLLAGAAAGMTGLTEYQAVPLAALLGWPLLTTRHPAQFKRIGVFVLGALPFAGLLLAYNNIAFGGPFELSYQHLSGSALTQLHGHGLAGATYPSLEAMRGLSMGSARGLLPTAPLAAFGIVALVCTRRILGARLHTILCASVSYLFLIVASSSVWHGAWSAGARLLVPALPALLVAAAVWLDKPATALSVLARTTAIYGFLFHFALQLTFAELPPELARPMHGSAWPMLQQALLAPNAACLLWGASLWTLLPAALLGIAVLWTLARAADEARSWRAWLSVASAAILWLASCVFPLGDAAPSDRDWLQLMRIFASKETACAR